MKNGRLKRWWRRWWKRGLVGVAALYLLFVFGVSDYLVIMPLPGKWGVGKARREFVEVGGRRVECWVARSAALAGGEAPQGYVLEFCGNATRAEAIADFVPQRWGRERVETWVMNYPGVGGSDGMARMGSMAPAALGVYDELARRGKPVFVEANSLGTTAALCVAARRKVAGCVLHDPVPLKQLLLGHYGWWNLWTVAAPVAWRVPNELDSVENAKKATAPCVFILAEKDEFVLPRYRELITRVYGGESRAVVLPGKGHYDSVGSESEDEVEADVAWLWGKAMADAAVRMPN